MGVAVWAPTEHSPEWIRKQNLKRQVDGWFYAGTLFAVLGLLFEIQSICVAAKAERAQRGDT